MRCKLLYSQEMLWTAFWLPTPQGQTDSKRIEHDMHQNCKGLNSYNVLEIKCLRTLAFKIVFRLNVNEHRPKNSNFFDFLGQQPEPNSKTVSVFFSQKSAQEVGWKPNTLLKSQLRLKARHPPKGRSPRNPPRLKVIAPHPRRAKSQKCFGAIHPPALGADRKNTKAPR